MPLWWQLSSCPRPLTRLEREALRTRHSDPIGLALRHTRQDPLLQSPARRNFGVELVSRPLLRNLIESVLHGLLPEPWIVRSIVKSVLNARMDDHAQSLFTRPQCRIGFLVAYRFSPYAPRSVFDPPDAKVANVASAQEFVRKEDESQKQRKEQSLYEQFVLE